MTVQDTFDPKHCVPFQANLEVEKVVSTFPAIDPAIDRLQVTEGREILFGTSKNPATVFKAMVSSPRTALDVEIGHPCAAKNGHGHPVTPVFSWRVPGIETANSQPPGIH